MQSCCNSRSSRCSSELEYLHLHSIQSRGAEVPVCSYQHLFLRRAWKGSHCTISSEDYYPVIEGGLSKILMSKATILSLPSCTYYIISERTHFYIARNGAVGSPSIKLWVAAAALSLGMAGASDDVQVPGSSTIPPRYSVKVLDKSCVLERF